MTNELTCFCITREDLALRRDAAKHGEIGWCIIDDRDRFVDGAFATQEACEAAKARLEAK